MNSSIGTDTVLVTHVGSSHRVRQAALMIDSLRTFGGSMSNIPILVFFDDDDPVRPVELSREGVTLHRLARPAGVLPYTLDSKVYTCARAEEMLQGNCESMLWIAPDCVIVNTPSLFQLEGKFDAALRPVHITNVGSLAEGSPDAFWKGVFHAAGVDDVQVTVESFIDCRILRAYYNTHVFSVSPALGLMHEWMQLFIELIQSRSFQQKCCSDDRHKLFLHQAVLSVLLASRIDQERIRMLPEEYSYPYNLHDMVPRDRKSATLNELVCIACEDRSLDPDLMDDIIVEEPLVAWLS